MKIKTKPNVKWSKQSASVQFYIPQSDKLKNPISVNWLIQPKVRTKTPTEVKFAKAFVRLWEFSKKKGIPLDVRKKARFEIAKHIGVLDKSTAYGFYDYKRVTPLSKGGGVYFVGFKYDRKNRSVTISLFRSLRKGQIG
jgi:hypothetical protein